MQDYVGKKSKVLPNGEDLGGAILYEDNHLIAINKIGRAHV